MNKRFALVIEYTCGKCVFLTDSFDIEKALKEFREEQEKKFKGSLNFKDFTVPPVISAEILPLCK